MCRIFFLNFPWGLEEFILQLTESYIYHFFNYFFLYFFPILSFSHGNSISTLWPLELSKYHLFLHFHFFVFSHYVFGSSCCPWFFHAPPLYLWLVIKSLIFGLLVLYLDSLGCSYYFFTQIVNCFAQTALLTGPGFCWFCWSSLDGLLFFFLNLLGLRSLYWSSEAMVIIIVGESSQPHKPSPLPRMGV